MSVPRPHTTTLAYPEGTGRRIAEVSGLPDVVTDGDLRTSILCSPSPSPQDPRFQLHMNRTGASRVSPAERENDP
jgi:hypothetical protein